ncbi:hypothetical protein MGMO_167c00110 [Methyloglobulus morosus KoM1]|uniref:Short-chain dehydrogenase/reductase SDR n=1 Tax=Methyloglobulus morosus KoM1 TaxID=1116472 RepID=V5B2H0_9GAMM|nr:hypothetical protein [Methyloglobulus morosus]ESS67390.1 hypothetical protein MGMO_167c00110 [Methyloglobulus morosus KoM1]
MKLDNKTLFVTGSNRGLGKALVKALLKHPVSKIYAAANPCRPIVDPIRPARKRCSFGLVEMAAMSFP